jgi:hypothetical protein
MAASLGFGESVSPSRVRVRESREDLKAVSQLRFAGAEAGDSSGTWRKVNVRRWKSLPRSAVKTVAGNTSLCAIVICKM